MTICLVPVPGHHSYFRKDFQMLLAVNRGLVKSPHHAVRGGVAQLIGRQISDQGVPGSIPRRCTFRCGLKQVTFTLCLVLVKPRKRWKDDRLGQTVTRLEITLCLMC